MILFADIVRYAVVVLALFNTAVLVRLMWLRWQRQADNIWSGSANYFTVTGLIVFMLNGIGRRIGELGTEPNRFLWGAALGTLLLTVGLSRTVTFGRYGRTDTPTTEGTTHDREQPGRAAGRD